jgi:hypothetical protein
MPEVQDFAFYRDHMPTTSMIASVPGDFDDDDTVFLSRSGSIALAKSLDFYPFMATS